MIPGPSPTGASKFEVKSTLSRQRVSIFESELSSHGSSAGFEATPAPDLSIAQPSITVMQCRLCSCTFTESGPRMPKILPNCMHTICAQCARELTDQRCPLDHNQIPLRYTTKDFPDNFMLIQHIQAMNVLEGKDKLCDVCDEEDADVSTHFCVDCKQYLCEIHFSAHVRSKTSKTHQVLTVNDYASRFHPSDHGCLERNHVSPLFCQVSGHESQRSDFFCELCEQVICTTCALMDHRDHVFGDIEDVYQRQKSELHEKINFSKETRTNIANSLSNVNSVLQSLEANFESASCDADELMESIVQKLFERKFFLMSQLKEIYDEKRSVLLSQRRLLSDALVRIDTSHSFCRELLETTDHQRALDMKRMVRLSLEEIPKLVAHRDLSPSMDDVVVFKRLNESKIIEDLETLGRVSKERPQEKACIPRWDQSRRGQDVMLSNGDSTVYRTDHRGWGGVQGKQVISSGQYRMRISIDSVGNNTFVGICYNDANLNEGPSKRNILLRENGEIWHHGEKVGTCEGFKTADVLELVIDVDEQKFQIFRDGKVLCTVEVLTWPVRPFVVVGSRHSYITIVP